MKTLIAIAVLCLLYSQCLAQQVSNNDYWQFPLIPSAGRMHVPEGALYKPKDNIKYKAIFNITSGVANPKQINDGLRTVAYVTNVFSAAGVPERNLHFVAVFHGPAINALLSDKRYTKLYGIKNPNTEIIRDLGKHGVAIVACAQEIANVASKTKMNPKTFRKWLDPDIKIAWSGLTTILMLQNRGYALYSIND